MYVWLLHWTVNVAPRNLNRRHSHIISYLVLWYRQVAIVESRSYKRDQEWSLLVDDIRWEGIEEISGKVFSKRSFISSPKLVVFLKYCFYRSAKLKKWNLELSQSPSNHFDYPNLREICDFTTQISHATNLKVMICCFIFKVCACIFTVSGSILKNSL